MKTPIDAVYIDFQKTFDTVSHPKLLLKLRAYVVQPSNNDIVLFSFFRRCVRYWNYL